MAYSNMDYKPNNASRRILERGWELVKSVPYQVTARWLFYALLQEGFYSKKDDYKNRFLPLLSRARHTFYQGWRPDTLSDDRRSAIERGGVWDTVAEWQAYMSKQGECRLQKWEGQHFYVEIWIEAEAMIGQFKHYSEHITIRPFYGMPSIPYKWEIAKALELAARWFNLPVVVLYFGDLDAGGLIIPETSVADIRTWCEADFDFVRVALNEGDPERYGLPESIDRPNCWQWEALPDRLAGDIICGAVAQYVDPLALEKRLELERRATLLFRQAVKNMELGA